MLLRTNVNGALPLCQVREGMQKGRPWYAVMALRPQVKTAWEEWEERREVKRGNGGREGGRGQGVRVGQLGGCRWGREEEDRDRGGEEGGRGKERREAGGRGKERRKRESGQRGREEGKRKEGGGVERGGGGEERKKRERRKEGGEMDPHHKDHLASCLGAALPSAPPCVLLKDPRQEERRHGARVVGQLALAEAPGHVLVQVREELVHAVRRLQRTDD